MELIKKNILLFSVIATTLIVSLVLTYFILVERNKMNGLINETNKLKSEIETLNSQKIAPVLGNLELIDSDTDKYTEKVKNIKLLFGQPYYRALKGFGAELGLTPEQLREKFSTFCQENVKSTTSYDQVIIKFRRRFKKSKKWEQAWVAFKREVEKATIGKVDDATAESILLFVLGLARELSILKADKFRQEFRANIIDKLEKANVTCDYDTTAFSLDYNKLPDREDIPLMIHNLAIIGDLIVNRLIPSGVIRIENFNIRRMEPEENGDYQAFRYSLTVLGTLDNIRKFVNNLAMAYNDSRVYVVRGLEITKVKDMAKEILDEAAGIQVRNGGRPNSGRGVDRDNQQPGNEFSEGVIPGGRGNRVIDKEENERIERAKKKEEREAKAQLKLPYYQRKVYNKTIIGDNKLCRAVIDIDYVRYKANDINLD
ncbi:MAG: hypothetical protein L3J71_10370 [Victivallaceae bacterium]|nr:hypothetical protein [Victivallaceae bacterium]